MNNIICISVNIDANRTVSGIDLDKCAAFNDFKAACQHGLDVFKLGGSNETY